MRRMRRPAVIDAITLARRARRQMPLLQQHSARRTSVADAAAAPRAAMLRFDAGVFRDTRPAQRQRRDVSRAVATSRRPLTRCAAADMISRQRSRCCEDSFSVACVAISARCSQPAACRYIFIVAQDSFQLWRSSGMPGAVTAPVASLRSLLMAPVSPLRCRWR